MFRNSIIAACVLCLCACEGQQFGARESGALGGAALGAGLGAIIGNQVGSTGAGIAIGSAFGALSGGLVGNEIDNQQAAIGDRDRTIEERDRQIRENRRMIDELKSRGIDVRETKRGVVVNLPDVLFRFGHSDLTSSAERSVHSIANVIQSSGRRHVSVEGHTDSIGTFEYNQRLSEDRAHSVAAALMADGIPRHQLSTRGYGERNPIASNSSDEGRSSNRRVEVVIENR